MEREEHIHGWDVDVPEATPDTRRPRRSLLFTPGDDMHKLEKAAGLAADGVILDLEDGVALSRKTTARDTVIDALERLDFGGRERLVRVNPVNSALCRRDLEAVVPARPDGVVVAKVESPDDLTSVAHFVTDVERQHGWPVGGMRLLAMIETARGVLNVATIAGATPRLDALIFGGEDFAANVGARRSKAGGELLYARSALVTAGAAYGLQAIDMIFVELDNATDLAEECAFARGLGFVGKTAIHPAQLAPINVAFTPTPEEVAYAERLLAAYEAAQAAGVGAFELDGRMVDRPMVRAARQVLARAERREA